ncbi:MAG: protein kinase domain-containing protein, partial [Mycobacteriales bacterium]
MDQPFAVDGYVLTDLIGFGATGAGGRGRDGPTHEPVALKRLWEPGADGLVLRLRQDAAVVAETAGSHAVRTLEVASLPGGEVVLVMDLAEGGSLASLLARRGRLHPSEVVTILGPLADALAALHARGIVHGDLTPANVLFTVDGRPMLGDVGLAQLTGEAPGDDVGFRDPALDAATPPTAASDCFALAAIGYAALTGAPPRSASRPDGVEPIVGRAPGVPAPLASAIEAAL